CTFFNIAASVQSCEEVAVARRAQLGSAGPENRGGIRCPALLQPHVGEQFDDQQVLVLGGRQPLKYGGGLCSFFRSNVGFGEFDPRGSEVGIEGCRARQVVGGLFVISGSAEGPAEVPVHLCEFPLGHVGPGGAGCETQDNCT